MSAAGKKEPAISIPYGNGVIAWFAGSNTWVKLEEPMWHLFRHASGDFGPRALDRSLAKRFCCDPGQREALISAFLRLKDRLGEPAPEEDSGDLPVGYLADRESLPFACHSYRVNRLHFSIHYASRNAEYYVHPLFRQFRSGEANSGIPDFLIDSRDNHHVLLSSDQHSARAFSTMSALKRQLLKMLAGRYHGIGDEDWIATLHASAVSDGTRSILFASSSGAGKSTLAFLLMQLGYRIMADDFVALHGKHPRACSFPTALSVKKEGMEFIRGQIKGGSGSGCRMASYGNGASHYLYPGEESVYATGPERIAAILFPEYDSDTSVELERLDTDEALQVFHRHAWLAPEYRHAKTFIRWFMRLPCYRFRYGDTARGLGEIATLFGQKTGKHV